MKKILYLIITLSIFLFNGCEDKDTGPDYTNCGWIRIDLENNSYNIFYRVGSNGSPGYFDVETECDYIHLYKDDKEVEVRKSDSGEVTTRSLDGVEYSYGRL